METIALVPGARYRYQGHVIRLHRVLDLQHVIGEYEVTGALERFPIRSLQPLNLPGALQEGDGSNEVETATGATEDILLIPEAAWQKAQQRLDILRPILEKGGGRSHVEAVGRQHKISAATLYRWLRAYEQTGSVRSLV